MKKLFPAILATLSFLFAGAQNLDSALAHYGTDYMPEKAYLHYDKTSYYAGETVWFKAYLMEGIFPAGASKNFYVDWVGDDGTVLSHTVSPIVDAVTNGQFDIPTEYKGNHIHVRAYTRWMLNFDIAFLYSKDLRILSKETVMKKTPTPAVQPSIQFFPEGGEAVAGVPNRIAFKAVDQWGRPVKVRGV